MEPHKKNQNQPPWQPSPRPFKPSQPSRAPCSRPSQGQLLRLWRRLHPGHFLRHALSCLSPLAVPGFSCVSGAPLIKYHRVQTSALCLLLGFVVSDNCSLHSPWLPEPPAVGLRPHLVTNPTTVGGEVREETLEQEGAQPSAQSRTLPHDEPHYL